MQYLISTPQQLSAAIRSRRKMQRMTQQDVASRVGLLPKTVSALENSPERSRLDSLFRLLAALDFELVVRTRGEEIGTEGREVW